VVHECFIIHADFFRRALNGNWAESDDRVITMMEDDPEIFDKYLHFVYTKEFPAMPHAALVSDQILGEYRMLARVYVLAEKLQDTRTKNAVVQAMMNLSQRKDEAGKLRMPDPEAITILYSGTVHSSAGRRLVVDLCFVVDAESLRKNIDNLPKDFLGDLAIALCTDRQPGRSKAIQNGVGSYLEK
jgi:hypothetical protein